MRHPSIRPFALAALLATVSVTTVPLASARADGAASAAAFDRALVRFQAGDLRVARVELLNALKQDPNNGPARLLFARVQLARGNGVPAETEVERAVKAGIPREKTVHLTAHALLIQNKPQAALDLLRGARIPPQFAAYAARIRGRALLATGKAEDGGRELASATRLAPGNAEAWVDYARYQAGTRDIAGAGRSLDRALALKPGSVEALNLKGGLTRVTAGLAQALPFYDRALQTDANSVETLLERAATLSDLKRFDAARADTKRVLGLLPGYPLAVYLNAVMLAREGKTQDAVAMLGQTKGALDNYPPARTLRAELALKQNNLGVAFENLSAVVAANPDNLAARRALAQVQVQRGDPKGALVTIAPLAARTDLDPGTLALIGTAHAQTGDFAGAQTFLERAAKLAPNVAAIRTQLAMTRLAQGDGAAAVAGLQQVLKSDPKSQQALMSLTFVQLRARDYKAAHDSASRLVAAYPNLPLALNLRGTSSLGLADTKAAEADFRAAIAKDPKFLDARRNLAQVLLATNRADAGKKELESIAAANPGDTPTLMLLADVAGRANAPNERVDWLKRAVTSAPRDPAPRAALIQAYVAAKNPSGALTEAAGLARDRPTDASALQLLAGAQLANKQNAAAVETVRRIVALAPKNVGARILLARAQAAAGPIGIADARATLQEASRLGAGAGAEQAGIALVQLELSAGNNDAAVAAAERVRASTTQKVAADKLVGDVNMRIGRPAAALAAYERVRAAAKGAAPAMLVARAQAAMGQNDASIATLKSYRAANPKDLMGGVALAEAYIGRKDWRAAIDTYLGMKNTPAAGSAEVLNNLAFAYAAVGDPRALAAAARANQLAPNTPVIQDTYGWVLLKQNRDPARALTLMQAAAKGLPNDPNVRHHLGLAYKANGMRPEAARELKAALAAKAGLDDPTGARAALAGVGG